MSLKSLSHFLGFMIISVASLSAQNLPVSFPSVEKYDLDQDGEFSPNEVLRMPDSMAAHLIVQHTEIGREERFAALMAQSADKIARILENALVNIEERNFLSREIANKDIELFASILMASRESPYDSNQMNNLGDGSAAVRLLAPLTDDLRKEALVRVEKENPLFATRLRSLTPDYIEWSNGGPRPEFQAVQDGYVLPSENVEPLPEKEDEVGIPTVLQREYIVSSSNLTRQLQSFGASPCLIYCVYDPDLEIGAMAHFDSLTDVDRSLDQIYADLFLLGSDTSRLEVSLVGGIEGASDELAFELLRSTRHRGVSSIYQDILNTRTGQSRAIVLDLETGELSNYRESEAASESERFFERLESLGSWVTEPSPLFPHPLMQQEGGVHQRFSSPPPGIIESRPRRRPAALFR